MVNVGALSISMGVNLAEFEAGMKRAAAVGTSQAGMMSAAMKRQTKEGAESLRLVDEAIGVHVSRPLSKVIAQIPGVGSALASLGGATLGAAGLIALAPVLIDGIRKIGEMTGATKAWKEILGLTGETFEQVAEGIKRQDEVLLTNLKRRVDMQDAYNRLVLGLKDADYEKSHIAALREETAEIAKQIALENQKVQRAADDTGWRTQVSGMNPLDAVLTGFGYGKDVAVVDAQANANKLAEAMKPLSDRLKAINDEITKGSWKIYRDDLDAAGRAVESFNKRMTEFKMHSDTGITNPAEFAAWEKSRIGSIPAGPAPEFGASASGVYGGTSEAMELYKIHNDDAFAMDKYRQIITSIQTPQEKFNQQVEILKALRPDLTPDQYALAMKNLRDELNSGTNKAFSNLGQSMGRTIEQAALFGRSWTDALKSITVEIGEMVIKMTLLKSLEGGSSSGVGGFFTSLLKGFSGARAGGGPVAGGSSYLVGERGPELFTPGSSGFITPSGGGSNIQIGPIDCRGAVDPQATALAVRRAIQESEARAVHTSLAVMREQNLRRR